jgi:predicted ATPase
MDTYNLPQYTTPLVGRGIEIVDIGDRLLDPTCRILTLVGPGGIGKTRLAIEAAAEQASTFQDGIFFVALQPVAAADTIVRTIGSAIGFEFSADGKPDFQLQQHLQEKVQLLVLDNVEHLLEGVESIADLVAATTKLKLLVTSREPLKLQDEWLYHVQGLPFPKQESSSEIETYDAVRLFADHAGRVQREFSLDEEQGPVIRICQLVQGMPLGIELAAKWRRRLPSVEIARELQKSLDILQTDLRDVPDRHRSMRAVFDHSWKLLTDDERRVFMSLSVFRGGFRRDAAEQVANASMAVLMSLVDKSLLRVNRNGRFDIHELQRQYASERLAESPELEAAVRDRHSGYYTAFIDRPVNDFLNAENQETLKVLDIEIDNFRSAWDWAIARQNVNYLKQALEGLYWYAWKRSWHEEGERAFRQAVAALRAVEPNKENLIVLGQALTLQAAMDIWLGRAAQADERALESVTILRPLDSRRDLAGALAIQGWAALEQQQWNAAKTLLEEAVSLFDDASQSEVKAFALGQLGHIARIQGDYAAGEYWYQEALSLGKHIGDQRTIAESLVHLGNLAQWRGQYFRARQLYQEGLEVARAAGFATIIIGALHNLGAVAIIIGELDVARGHIEESLSIATEDGKGPGIAWSHVHLANVAIAQGDHAAAQEQYQAALEIPPGGPRAHRLAKRGICCGPPAS